VNTISEKVSPKMDGIRFNPTPYSTPSNRLLFKGVASTAGVSSFSSQPAAAPARTSKVKLNWFQRQVAGVVRFILNCLPKSFYQALEAQTLYVGQFGDKSPSRELAQEVLNRALPGKPKTIEAMTFAYGAKSESTAWVVQPEPGKPVVVFSHGNASSIRELPYHAALIKEGYGFVSYSYPGFDAAKGTPNEKNLCASLEGLLKKLNEKGIPDSHIILYGVSLGGAVTVDVAARHSELKGVILQSTMTRFKEVAQHFVQDVFCGSVLNATDPFAEQKRRAKVSEMLPLHQHVVSEFKSIDKIPKIKSPLLVIHGSKDTLMPASMGKELADAAVNSQQVTHVTLEGGHNLPLAAAHQTILHNMGKMFSVNTESSSSPTVSPILN
jgi:uncharacterized protein